MNTPPTKVCSKCGVSKSLEEFYREKRRAHKDGRDTKCKVCHRTYDKEREKENKVKYRKDPKFRERVRLRCNKATNKWFKTDKGKLYVKRYKALEHVRNSDRKRNWRWRHTERGIKCLRAYYKNRRKYDTGFRIRVCLTIGINKVVKGIKKTWKTMSLVGCSIVELKEHLQRTALSNGYTNFDINNYSSQEYHIDHIRPCASFDLTKVEQLSQCFHYTNLQILKAEVNNFKRAKIGWNISMMKDSSVSAVTGADAVRRGDCCETAL